MADRERERIRLRMREAAGQVGVRGLTTAVRRGVLAALQAEGVRDAEIAVVLMAEDEISELNQQYLSHAGPTDVISFPLWAEGESPVGDVCIGVEQALRQATALGVSAREELVRLAIHGTLHVLGYDHPAGARRERSAMWTLQERIVAEVMAT